MHKLQTQAHTHKKKTTANYVGNTSTKGEHTKISQFRKNNNNTLSNKSD